MQVLKSKRIDVADSIVHYVNENNIKREDILTITQDKDWNYTIFFYAEPNFVEVKHGLFS